MTVEIVLTTVTGHSMVLTPAFSSVRMALAEMVVAPSTESDLKALAVLVASERRALR